MSDTLFAKGAIRACSFSMFDLQSNMHSMDATDVFRVNAGGQHVTGTVSSEATSDMGREA